MDTVLSFLQYLFTEIDALLFIFVIRFFKKATVFELTIVLFYIIIPEHVSAIALFIITTVLVTPYIRLFNVGSSLPAITL